MFKVLEHLFNIVFEKSSEMWTDIHQIHPSTKLTLIIFIAVTTFSVRTLKQAYSALAMQRINILSRLVTAWLLTLVGFNTLNAFAPNVLAAIGTVVSFLLAAIFTIIVSLSAKEEARIEQNPIEDHEVKMPDPHIEV